jgi:hypothetical protein
MLASVLMILGEFDVDTSSAQNVSAQLTAISLTSPPEVYDVE